VNKSYRESMEKIMRQNIEKRGMESILSDVEDGNIE